MQQMLLQQRQTKLQPPVQQRHHPRAHQQQQQRRQQQMVFSSLQSQSLSSAQLQSLTWEHRLLTPLQAVGPQSLHPLTLQSKCRQHHAGMRALLHQQQHQQ
jgi:hypothetical protein